MQHREAITLLGGPESLAQSLGIACTATVRSWCRRSIPARYWHRVALIAEQRGLPQISISALEQSRRAHER